MDTLNLLLEQRQPVKVRSRSRSRVVLSVWCVVRDSRTVSVGPVADSPSRGRGLRARGSAPSGLAAASTVQVGVSDRVIEMARKKEVRGRARVTGRERARKSSGQRAPRHRTGNAPAGLTTIVRNLLFCMEMRESRARDSLNSSYGIKGAHCTAKFGLFMCILGNFGVTLV